MELDFYFSIIYYISWLKTSVWILFIIRKEVFHLKNTQNSILIFLNFSHIQEMTLYL